MKTIKTFRRYRNFLSNRKKQQQKNLQKLKNQNTINFHENLLFLKIYYRSEIKPTYSITIVIVKNSMGGKNNDFLK